MPGTEHEAIELLEQVKKLIRHRKRGKKKIVGNVEYHRSFYSANLKNERDIIIWLPPGYNEIDRRFPVLYMHDGQNIMDSNTSFTKTDWRVDETVTELINKDMLREIIVVGIYNTPDRLEEYSDSEKGHSYIKFLLEEVKPFIDSSYRTLPDKNNTGVMGSSMGGLISFLIVWNHPGIISKAAGLSNSFHYDDRKTIKMVKEYEGEKKDFKLYIDSGEDGVEENQLMFAELTLKDYRLGKELDYYYDIGAQHTESAWAERLERPLLFLFGK
ncbi:MAG: alpha/beta hydrolase-fold protein [Ignavibacteriaceae bacterium]